MPAIPHICSPQARPPHTATGARSTAAAVDLVLVDNSERTDSRVFFERVSAVGPRVLCLKPPRNLGYFPGAHFGLRAYRHVAGEPDWVVVSNVDVEFHDTAFWLRLLTIERDRLGAVLAPWVWSKRLRRNVNPMMERRPQRYRMRFYKLVFRYYYVLRCYEALAVVKSLARNAVRSAVSRVLGRVPAAHGAFTNGDEARVV